VLLGNEMPRPDRSDTERNKWCRAMLILFKPWRSVKDLKRKDETWTNVFDRTEFSPNACKIKANMNIENECKDARDKYKVLHKAGKVKPIMPGNEGVPSSEIESLTSALHHDAALDV
ncbi:hypothetical protein DFH07DRAFT_722694, partial [Mycena maculata]